MSDGRRFVYGEALALAKNSQGCELDCQRQPGTARERISGRVESVSSPLQDLINEQGAIYKGAPSDTIEDLERRCEVARKCRVAETGLCALLEADMLYVSDIEVD